MKRPETRAGCVNVPRPCPFATCRYSTRVDVRSKAGRSLKVYREAEQEAEPSEDPTVIPLDVPAGTSCALDVAERGSHSLEEIGEIYGVSKEAVRLIEESALLSLRKKLEDVGISPRELFGRRSGVVPEDSEDSMNGVEDIYSFIDGMKSLPRYPGKRVEQTADGRRVGDSAPGTIRRRIMMGSFRSLHEYRKKKLAEGK